MHFGIFDGLHSIASKMQNVVHGISLRENFAGAAAENCRGRDAKKFFDGRADHYRAAVGVEEQQAVFQAADHLIQDFRARR